MYRFCCCVFFLIAGWPQGAQQNIGTKVVWRYVSGGTAGSEITIYTMGDRRRTEYRNTSLRRYTLATPLVPADPPANVVIHRCDLQRSFELNTHTQEYASKEYPPTVEEQKARDADEPNWDSSDLPVVRVETTTVDTGEREEIFGQVARHVTITTRSTSLADSKNAPSVFVKDGWYLDYDRRLSCESHEGPRTRDFSWFMTGGHRLFMEKIENVAVGNPEEGLLVKKGQNNLSMTIQGTNGVNLSNETEVTEFFKGPLDPALFEIPSEFKLVEKIELGPIPAR